MTTLFKRLLNKASTKTSKQKVTQPQILHHGLSNQGATCYLNSVLQVLFMTPEIQDRLDPNLQAADRELRNIFEKMKETTCGTENITKSLGIESVSELRDAAECLDLILHKISPQASEVFQGELTYTTICSKGHSNNKFTKPFWTLPLSLKDTEDTTYSVERSFKTMFESKSFSGNSKVYCNKCKSGWEMVKSPQILTLILRRFDFSIMSHDKFGCFVDVPRELQIKNKMYKLYGMVNHMGSLRDGHYTATILSNEDKTWYEFNDDRVNKVEEQPFAETGTYKSNTAYLLLYRVTRPQRLHYGLRNQGGTCYLNSVLQVLFHTTEIHDRLDSELHAVQLRNIFKDLKEKTCGTEAITATFGIADVSEQRDAADCLEMILRKTSQQVSEVFQGELMYTTKCSKGHSINEETNPFWTFPLSLKDTDNTVNSVESSFKTMFESKSFSGDDKVYCNECKKKREAKTGCEMVKSPQILILLLKRFDFDYNTMSHVKSDCCVAVPCELQIKNKTYKLYGMVNHMGSLRDGHYTATILSNEDKTWYEFNDDHVNKVEEQPFAETGTYKSKAAYLLLYRASESKMSHETQTKDLTDNTLQKQDDTKFQKPVETSSRDLTCEVKEETTLL